MRQTKEQPSVTERATGEQKRKIWEAIFGLAGVEEAIEFESKKPLVERALSRWFKPSEDVMRNTLRVKHLVSFPESVLTEVPLVIDYYRGAAACLWIDLPVLTDDNVLAGFSEVYLRKGEGKAGLAFVFNREGEASSLTLVQGEALLKLLTPSETSRAE